MKDNLFTPVSLIVSAFFVVALPVLVLVPVNLLGYGNGFFLGVYFCLLCFGEHFFHDKVLLFSILKSTSEYEPWARVAPTINKYRSLFLGILFFVMVLLSVFCQDCLRR